MDIKIFMCCHKDFDTVPPLCTPIQCGSAINSPVDGALPDNIGDNISEKNPEYCELTAHYYAWKNVEADYYGFCHYRRFFCFDDNCKKPYIVRKKFSRKDMALLGTKKKIENLLQNYDIVIPRSEDMGISARGHYITAKYHHKEDLELFIRLLKEKYPQIAECADWYLAQNKQYFCNMFIMKKEIFFEYCEMLFGVLSEFDRLKKVRGGFQEDRVDGYLGEIFTGIFVWYKRKNGIPTREACRIDCECLLLKRSLYYLFPPESRSRFLIKQIIKNYKTEKKYGKTGSV